MKAQAVVLLSGGMDSLVTLAIAQKTHAKIAVLHLKYGQKTSKKEEECFDKIADYYQISPDLRKKVDLTFLSQIGGSSLTDQKIEVSTYQGDQPGIPSSYVPFRNSIILSLAVSWAEVLGAQHLFIGANQEDSPGYPDCRKEYYEAFQQVIKLGTKAGDIRLHTPVISLSKKDIVKEGQALQVPFNLSWSCYRDSKIACGQCDSCALRLRGFHQANLIDPIPYQQHP